MTAPLALPGPHQHMDRLPRVTDMAEVARPVPRLLVVTLQGGRVAQEEERDDDAGGVHEHDGTEDGLEAGHAEDDAHQHEAGHVSEEVHGVEDAQSPGAPLLRDDIGHVTLQRHEDDGRAPKGPPQGRPAQRHGEVEHGVQGADQVQQDGQHRAETRQHHRHLTPNVVTPRPAEEGEHDGGQVPEHAVPEDVLRGDHLHLVLLLRVAAQVVARALSVAAELAQTDAVVDVEHDGRLEHGLPHTEHEEDHISHDVVHVEAVQQHPERHGVFVATGMGEGVCL